MAGMRCGCDPVVRATTYGGKDDGFIRVVDSLNADGSISRLILARGSVGHIDVVVGFVK